MKAKKFVYAKRFAGEPKLSDFELVEEELPCIQENEILVEAEYLSVDPYMRIYVANLPLGITMVGGQIARVIESKHSKYPVGEFIYADIGWRTFTVLNPDTQETPIKPYVLPKTDTFSRTLFLGALGLPGISAHLGLIGICKPNEGETVVVTGAAGAVGSIVGQIAKIKACRVVGFAGSDEKCKWLEEELGFDKAINYKTTESLAAALKKAAPNGVDCYFDNVGGEISAIIYTQMNSHGRIAVCGAISGYNGDLNDPVKVPSPTRLFVQKQLKLEGFLVRSPEHSERREEAKNNLYEWAKSGLIKHHETISDGFENMPQAFIDMLRGKNLGKAIVKV